MFQLLNSDVHYEDSVCFILSSSTICNDIFTICRVESYYCNNNLFTPPKPAKPPAPYKYQ